MGSNKPETKNNNLLPTVIQTKGPEVQIPVVPLSFLSLIPVVPYYSEAVE